MATSKVFAIYEDEFSHCILPCLSDKNCPIKNAELYYFIRATFDIIETTSSGKSNLGDCYCINVDIDSKGEITKVSLEFCGKDKTAFQAELAASIRSVSAQSGLAKILNSGANIDYTDAAFSKSVLNVANLNPTLHNLCDTSVFKSELGLPFFYLANGITTLKQSKSVYLPKADLSGLRRIIIPNRTGKNNRL